MDLTYLNLQQQENRIYSDAVCVEGRYLFLSGLIAEDLDTGELHLEDITTQTRLILNNLARILEQYGSDMEHVIRVEIFLADFGDKPAMNAEYLRHFSQGRMPSRICVGNTDLSDGCKIEVMAIAVKK